MNGKSWSRRLGTRSFPDPVDPVRRRWLDEVMRRLSPDEREEAAGLRERLDERGFADLTDAEIDRLDELATRLQNGDTAEGRVD